MRLEYHWERVTGSPKTLPWPKGRPSAVHSAGNLAGETAGSARKTLEPTFTPIRTLLNSQPKVLPLLDSRSSESERIVTAMLKAVSSSVTGVTRRSTATTDHWAFLGDVGCGKTIVALLACMEVIGSGLQAAFMVPTELLAVQHYEHVLSLLENVKENECTPSIPLLTGSTHQISLEQS